MLQDAHSWWALSYVLYYTINTTALRKANIQRAITPKVGKPELRFLCSACRLMVFNVLYRGINMLFIIL